MGEGAHNSRVVPGQCLCEFHPATTGGPAAVVNKGGSGSSEH